jgi:hypothetical protein
LPGAPDHFSRTIMFLWIAIGILNAGLVVILRDFH